MQTYTRITNDFTGVELPGKIDENLQSLKSDFSGTAFPTEHLVEGMTCYRTDLDTEYRYVGGSWKVSGIATQAEAEEGTDNIKSMTALRVKQSVLKNAPAPSVMTGANASTGGKSGLVPQPKAGDNNKVLHGDGLWKKAIGFESYWEASEKVSVGDIRFPYGRENSGYILECVKEGTTGSNQPVVSENLIDDYPVNINNLEGTLGIEKGGTGASTAKQALANLGGLPLSGGVMTGAIQTSGSDSLGALKRTNNQGTLSLFAGTTSDGGATLILVGADNHYNAGEEGAFFIKATKGGTPIYLAGYPTGGLYWDSKRVLTEGLTNDYIIESYRNGVEWYEVYKSGKVRQGGACVLNKSWTTNTFLKPFADTTYTIILQQLNAVGTGLYQIPPCVAKRSGTQFDSALTDGAATYYASWLAEGQGA